MSSAPEWMRHAVLPRCGLPAWCLRTYALLDCVSRFRGIHRHASATAVYPSETRYAKTALGWPRTRFLSSPIRLYCLVLCCACVACEHQKQKELVAVLPTNSRETAYDGRWYLAVQNCAIAPFLDTINRIPDDLRAQLAI